jgi:DNA-binding MarR family transcriptional regulator
MTNLSERIKQPEFESKGQEAILSLLAASAHLKDKLSLICAGKQLSLPQFNILRILKGAQPEGYARCEISVRMVEKAPDITRILDRMIQEGIVERTKSSQDMRQSIAKITTKGINIIEELNSQIKSFQQSFQSTLGTEKCKNLADICDKVLNI